MQFLLEGREGSLLRAFSSLLMSSAAAADSWDLPFRSAGLVLGEHLVVDRSKI